jgi:hypothetical protein
MWAGLLTLLIAGPWLLPGYLFGTDWPGPRRFAFPTEALSWAPFEALLAASALVIGGEATGKLVFCGFVFTATALAYRAVPTGGFVARAVGSSIYVANPFVYGRLQYGQLFVLAGYAVLPWVAIRIRRLLNEPSLVTATLAAVSLTLIGILSVHIFLAAIVLSAALATAHLVAVDDRFGYVKRRAVPFLVTTIATLGASAFWIIPLLTARGYQGTTLAGIGTGDLKVFATIPDQHVGLIPNLLGLYGFWAEGTGRFDSMKQFVPIWPVVLLLLLIVCGIGAFSVFRRRDQLLAPWLAGLLAAAVIALVLEMGVSHPFTAGLVGWLDANFSPYRGMRDAGKWAAILAFAYSQLGALGAVAILEWIRTRAPRSLRSEWIASTAVALLLALPLYYGNGLLYGAHGEIKPSQYPPGWYAADRLLSSDRHPGRTLFLPWHEYLGFSFIRNQNKVVAPPGPAFFSVPLVVSADPETPGVALPADPDQIALYDLVREGSQGNWAQVLAAHKIKYVLLAHEVDWAKYDYLDQQADLVLVQDFGSIALYRNDLVS